MRRIGIYSGSFDPVHAGHLAFAHAAAEQCDLESVVFIPERQPRNKPTASPLAQRVDMLEKQLADTSFEVFVASEPTLRVRTLHPQLQSRYPDSQFVFLLGSDVVRTSLPRWDDVESLASISEFAIGMRANDSESAVVEILNTLNITFTLISTDYSHLSSSQIRLAQLDAAQQLPGGLIITDR